MSARTSEAARLLADAKRSAASAGLHYVSDERPGIRRELRRAGAGAKSFRYLDANGREVRDAATLERIDALKIPPAWTDVWICSDPRGHIQATGRDARRRKQYRYHAGWRDSRDATKFEKILDFAGALPELRARVSADLGKHSLSRERVLATAVRLLDTTLIRIGNEEYTRENHSYGLTTLRRRHAKVAGDEVALHFRGKSGKDRRVSVRDRRVARVVRRCQELPGQELFKYVGQNGELHGIASEDVNEYLREATGDSFTAKDFRTWAATVLAGLALREICAREDSPRSVDKQLVAAIASVSQVLGNTPAVCRKSYVHPVVLGAHKDGLLLESLERAMTRRTRRPVESGLRPEEAAVLAFLRAQLRARPKKTRARIVPTITKSAAPAPRTKPRGRDGIEPRSEARSHARGASARPREKRAVDR